MRGINSIVKWVSGIVGLRGATDNTRIGNTDDALHVALKNPVAGFGEVLVVNQTPVVQIEALHGIQTDVHETFTGPSGTATVKDDHGGKEFHVTSGTAVGGYGIIRSRYVVRYRPGQGARLRFTARYGTPQPNTAMRAGGVNLGTELSFGYNGETFGLLYRTAGRPEIRTLTVGTPAAGNETLTITMNGTAYTVTVTAGTVEHNAYEIAGNATIANAYNIKQNEADVVAQALAVGPQTGEFSVTSTGSFAATFATIGVGVVVSDTFISQSAWNITSLNTTTDAFILDPTKGQVFEILYQYLGYGEILYACENPETGRFVQVHKIKYANAYTNPSLETPSLKLGWFAASLGNTASVEMFGASGFGSVDGPLVPLKNPVGHANTKTGIDTNLTNILSIRVRTTFNGYINLDEVFPDVFSVATEGTKTAIAELHLNATLGGEPNWKYHNETNSIVEYDTSGTTVTGATEIISLALGKTDSKVIDLRNYNIKLVRGDVLTVAAKATSGTTEVTSALTWTED